MRVKSLIPIIACCVIVACSSIPSKSVFEDLSTEELSKILQETPDFETEYRHIKNAILAFNDIEKAKYSSITWREIYKAYKFSSDTTKFQLLFTQWENEWKETYSKYDGKVDSVISYWHEYMIQNTPERFVHIEFSGIKKNYYPYTFDIEDVSMGFRLVPLDGTIEQVKFSYRFSAKIDRLYGEKNYCIITTPFKSPVIRYWKVDYRDNEILERLNSETFKRDYDIHIEITDVRKNGINYSIYDLYMPQSLKDYFMNEYDFMDDFCRANIIREELCPSYQSKDEYLSNQYEHLMKNKFPKEFEFFKIVDEK